MTTANKLLLVLSLVFVASSISANNYKQTISYDQLRTTQKNSKTSFNFVDDSYILSLNYDKHASICYKYYHQLPNTLTPQEKALFSSKSIVIDDKPTTVYVLEHGNVTFETPQANPANKPNSRAYWQTYLYTPKRRFFENTQSPEPMTVQRLARYISRHNVIIYTGAGLSKSADICDMKELEKSLGIYDLKEDSKRLTQFIAKNREEIRLSFEIFCKSAFFSYATPGHHALERIAKHRCIPLITENIDLLHEQSGVSPYRLSETETTKEQFSPTFLQNTDAIICIGLSSDDRAFLSWYKEHNPNGKIIAINLEQPNYLGNEDYFIQGDAQEILTELEKKVVKKCLGEKLNNIGYFFYDAFIDLLERLVLPKDNFFAMDREQGIYRSRQLSPQALESYIKKHDIKTVVNLRGDGFGENWWEDERRVVETHDVSWVNIPMEGHEYPTIKQFTRLLASFKSGPFPLLIHCRAGADRTGEAAAVWVLTQKTEIPIKKRLQKALTQISIKYRHLKFMLPKKSEFVRKFGACYLWLLATLQLFERDITTLSPEKLEELKDLSNESDFFEHAVKATQLFNKPTGE